MMAHGPESGYESLEKQESCLSRLWKKKWFVLLCWQLSSVFFTIQGVCCTILSTRGGATLPFLQLSMGYFLIMIANTWRDLKNKASWLKFIFASLCMFAGDSCTIYAYSTTSMASTVLLCSTIIFWVAPLTYFFYKRKYSIWQILSFIIGMGGVSLVFVADGVKGSKLLGNILALAAAISYAFATTLEEGLIHEFGNLYIIRFGIIVFPVSGILAGAVEWKEIWEYNWEWQTVFALCGYSVCISIYYCFIPIVMAHSNATELNISFLTSNFYSLGISILFFGQKASWLYLLGFLCIPVSIIVFSLFPYKEKKTLLNKEVSQTSEEYLIKE